MRVRSRRFHCAVWDPFTICSWFYWWLILEFNDVFPRVSEEMIFEKYELKPYVLCFSLQYWTPCLSSLLGLFGSFCCYLMVLFREWSSRCFLDLLLVPITVASKSFCWYLIVLFREWSCWWFLDILLIHIIVASEILVFPKLKLRKVCLWLNLVFLVCVSRIVFGLRWWCFLFRVYDFWCKPNTPDLSGMRNRKFSLCLLISFFFW